MSSSVSNPISLSSPFISQRNGKQGRYLGVYSKPYTSIRVTAAQGRDNFDGLQKANSRQSPPQPKKKMAQVAPLGIWDRFPTARTIQQMMDTMERVMEDPFTYPSLADGNVGSYRRGRTPWEIKEGGEDYKMRFDMPGMTREDVKIWVEEKMLVVKAEKLPKKKNERGEEVEEDEDWSAKSYGRYSSRIALPDNIEMEKIKAEVKDGVLYITIPKARQSSKIVDINVQ